MPADNSRHQPILIPKSTLETIDRAFLMWVKEDMDIFANYPNGWNKVPILWAAAERVHQSKADVTLRDDNGNLNLPLITLERLSVNKEPGKRGAYYSNILPDSTGGTSSTFQIAKKVNQRETTKYTAAKNITTGKKQPFKPNRNNNKTVYDVYTIPQPVHVNIEYKLVIKAQFQQQINDILTTFLKYSGHINGFMIGQEPHRYEAFFPSNFSSDNNVTTMGDNEKMYQTTIDMKVLGYLLNDDKNSEYLEIEKRQTIVKVRTPRERIMIGDKHPNEDDGRFYKE